MFGKTPLTGQNDCFLKIWGAMAPLASPWLHLWLFQKNLDHTQVFNFNLTSAKTMLFRFVPNLMILVEHGIKCEINWQDLIAEIDCN